VLINAHGKVLFNFCGMCFEPFLINRFALLLLLYSMVLSNKMQKEGATAEEIERAMYLAALSQFCIYNPIQETKRAWPLGDGDPLHKSAMTKQSCTLNDFHRALRARDPLGWGFEASDSLLHLIWQLLAWGKSLVREAKLDQTIRPLAQSFVI